MKIIPTILEKIKVQDILSYFSFDIHDLIWKLVTKMKLINRASKWFQAETHRVVCLDFTSMKVKVLIWGNGHKIWIWYNCMTFCYSVTLICKIWKENQWPFWSCWSGLPIAAKQRLIAQFVWILHQKQSKRWFSKIVKNCVEVLHFKIALYSLSRHALTDASGFWNLKRFI